MPGAMEEISVVWGIDNLKTPKVVWWKAKLLEAEPTEDENIFAAGLLNYVVCKDSQSSTSKVQFHCS